MVLIQITHELAVGYSPAVILCLSQLHKCSQNLHVLETRQCILVDHVYVLLSNDLMLFSQRSLAQELMKFLPV